MQESNFKNNQTEGCLMESRSIKLVRFPGFLSKQDRDALYTAVCEEEGRFNFQGAMKSTKFLSTELNGKNERNAGAVNAAAQILTNRTKEQLPFLFETLNIKPFKVSDISFTFINCLDGHYGSVHADSVNDLYQISILYYFHKTPKVFRGGDLNIHEFDNENSNGYCEKASFQIEQEDNMLIAFPSHTFHGVTETQCPSTDFADGRFVAVAFLGR